MLKIPFKWQVLSLPVVLIIPIVGVILLTHSYLTEISDKNETVKDWARATDQLTIALAASHHMINLLDQISTTTGDQQDETKFNYAEQSLLLNSTLRSQTLSGKVDTETNKIFANTISATTLNEKFDGTHALIALTEFQNRLDTTYSTLQAKKREIYLTSNEFIRNSSSKLATMLLSVLGTTLLLGLLVALWLLKNTQRQLNSITQTAIKLLDEPETTNNSITSRNNDFGQVLDYFEQLKLKLLETAANQNLLEGTELERKRIAMDIHDQFLAEFTDLRRQINSEKENEDATRLLRQVDHALERLTTELRDIIDDLHPSSLNMLGLEAAILNFVNRNFTGDALPEYYISIEREIETKLTSLQLIHIYRVITESIHNIIRHAHCTRFEITLKASDTGLVLTIEDNGIGFDIQAAIKKGGHGLINIQQRCKAIHGVLHWKMSRFSQGTCLSISIPNKHLNSDNQQNTKRSLIA